MKLMMAVTDWKFELFGGASYHDRSPGHASYSNAHNFGKDHLGKTYQTQSGDDSTMVETNFATSSTTEEARNDSSGTTSQSHGNKSVYFNPSTHFAVKSSGDKKKREETFGKTDHIATKRSAVANKIQMRKNSKSLLRAKSVEFSFNSSSTDGSIFDYEKAVSQARQCKENEGMEVTGGTRYSRQKLQDQKHTYIPSYPLNIGKENDTQDVDLQNSKSFGNVENRDAGNSYYHGTNNMFHNQDYEKYPEEREHQIVHDNYERVMDHENENDLEPGERYIGLSYKPWQHKPPPYQGYNRYFSMEDLLKVDESVPEDEFESGIDIMDNNVPQRDPYDLVIRKIKNISASDLPNFEKLRFVSTLLANSDVSKPTNPQNRTIGSKLSMSTFDLRERESKEDARTNLANSNNTQFGGPTFAQNPVEAVVRMKQNLAKSMEELSTYKLAVTSDDNKKMFAKTDTRQKSSPASERYLTELKFQPSSLSNRKYESQKISPSSTDTKWQDNYSDIPVTQSAHGASGHDLPVVKEPASSSKKSHHQHHNLSKLEEIEPSSHGPEPSNWNHGRRLSSSRLSNLSSVAGRTFISPSFLRPATSMKNISSTNYDHKNLTMDLIRSMDLDNENEQPIDNVNMPPDKKQTNYNTGTFLPFPTNTKNETNSPDEGRRSHITTSFTTQSKDDFNVKFDSTNFTRRQYASVDQSQHGYSNPYVYPRRPWSLSVDSGIYSVFQREQEQEHHPTYRLSSIDVERWVSNIYSFIILNFHVMLKGIYEINE